MKMFIDFDKEDQIIYTNYYFEDSKKVLKIAIGNEKESDSNLKISDFDLSNYIYLIPYD